MKKQYLVFGFRWVIPLFLVFICVFLPGVSYKVKEGLFVPPPFLERVLFSIFLSYPYLNAAEILSKISESNKYMFEQYCIKGGKGDSIPRIVAALFIIVMAFVMMFFTLQAFFSFTVIQKLIISVVYTTSVAMLKWNIYDYLRIS